MFDQDPERVCILQGPVAVKGSTVKDEPIKELLGNINSSLIERLLERSYGGDVNAVPVVDYLSVQPSARSKIPLGVAYTRNGDQVVYETAGTGPSPTQWLEIIAGPHLCWLQALITTGTIVQGSAYIDNPLRRMLSPRPGLKIEVEYNGDIPSHVVIYGAARSFGEHSANFKAIDIKYEENTRSIKLTMFEERRGVSVPLYFEYQYQPSMGFAPIHEVIDGRNRRIKEFYWKLWYGDDASLPDIDVRDRFVGPEVTINAADIEQFCTIVGNQGESFKPTRTPAVQAPMDFAIVTGWQVCWILTSGSQRHDSLIGYHEIYLSQCH